MTKRIPLDRLRDISKQRSIRSAHMPQIRSEPDHPNDGEPVRFEWPIRPPLLP
jgi:hypothetical protein